MLTRTLRFNTCFQTGFRKACTLRACALRALLLSSALLVTACSDGSNDPQTNPDNTDGSDTPATSASYRLTFNATWSEQTHALNFPGAAAHFSPLTGAVHNEQVIFWEPGQPATAGIKQVAETGARSVFGTEVQAAMDSGYATAAINGSGIGVSPDSTSVEFTVTRTYPQITVVTMLAPSPDWFVGLHNYSLLDTDDNFIQNATLSLPLYDSGTDNGVRYTSANDPASSAGTIVRLTSDPADTPFINGEPQVGTFVLERLP